MQRHVAEAWPGEEVLTDDGGSGREHLRPKQVAVLGSESFSILAHYDVAREAFGPLAPLSLDFRGDAFLGPRELLEDAALWPERVIVMTLARVGSGEGPDVARLAEIVARAKKSRVFAAGGVRNVDDLKRLRDIGVAGALVATALHAGRITLTDLDQIGAVRSA